MKKCISCGKPLDEQANFCPYCMTKQITETKIKPIPVKKRSKFLPLIFIIGASIIIALVAIILILSKNETNDSPSPPPIEPGATSDSVTETKGNTELDLLMYMGNWYSLDESTGKAAKDIYNDGGYTIEVLDIKENVILFNFISVSAPPSNKVAGIEGIEAIINGNSGDFTFNDDGWGNAGYGTITFEDESIVINTEINARDPLANWDISTEKQILYRTSDFEMACDLANELIFKTYEEISNSIVLEKSTYNLYGGPTYEYADGIELVFEGDGEEYAQWYQRCMLIVADVNALFPGKDSYTYDELRSEFGNSNVTLYYVEEGADNDAGYELILQIDRVVFNFGVSANHNDERNFVEIRIS